MKKMEWRRIDQECNRDGGGGGGEVEVLVHILHPECIGIMKREEKMEGLYFVHGWMLYYAILYKL